jgi:hypothetical protein
MATGFLALLPILPVPLLPLLVLQTLGLGGFLLSVASSGGLCRTLLLLQTLNNDSTADPRTRHRISCRGFLLSHISSSAFYVPSSSSRTLASFKSAVSKPSVNQL